MPLAVIIIFSFIFLVMTNDGASEPLSVQGIIFWLSFLVFASMIIHLQKNEEYYKRYIDEHFG